jgi:hypothetical protein
VSEDPKQADASQTSAVASAPAATASKAFDVALVDPHNPAVEHWPRVRVTIEAASVDDLSAEQKAPPKGGESAAAETKRLAFLVAEIERQRAIEAYNDFYKLSDSHLRYDVVEARPGATPPAALSQEWIDHLAHIHGN